MFRATEIGSEESKAHMYIRNYIDLSKSDKSCLSSFASTCGTHTGIGRSRRTGAAAKAPQLTAKLWIRPHSKHHHRVQVSPCRLLYTGYQIL